MRPARGFAAMAKPKPASKGQPLYRHVDKHDDLFDDSDNDHDDVDDDRDDDTDDAGEDMKTTRTTA